jgi:predicted DNA-binding protein
MSGDARGGKARHGGTTGTGAGGTGVPRKPEDIAAFLDGLTFEPVPAHQDESALLDALPPPGSSVMVVRSLRLPLELDEAVAAAAKAAEMPKTTWIRQAIEMSLAVQAEDDQPISRAEALRALTLLRPARHSA